MNPVTKNASTPELVKQSVEDIKELIQLEVKLAKVEMRDQLAQAKVAAVLFGATAFAALTGAALLLVALALAIAPTAIPALAIGLSLLAAAAALGFAGWKVLPHTALPRARRKVENDVRQLKERVA